MPFFSASSLRWQPGVLAVMAADAGATNGALSYGPAHELEHHPDLFFYGIHPAEALYTVMGKGCAKVSFTAGVTSSVATGVWADGRLGSLYAIHSGATEYKVVRFGEKTVVEQRPGETDYTPMLREIVKFFQTKEVPVSAQETLEIYAFMEAANESKRRNGAAVSLREVLKSADCPEEWLPPALPKK